MALVTCKECGGKVADSAPSCPHCGSLSPGGSACLSIKRKGLVNAAVSVEVIVDNRSCGIVRVAGKLDIPLAPGDHSLELVTSSGRRTTGMIHINGGQTLNGQLSVSALRASPKLDIE